MQHNFTESQVTTIHGAFAIAREKYIENATYLRKEKPPGYERLAEQFERQADDVQKLMAEIEYN